MKKKKGSIRTSLQVSCPYSTQLLPGQALSRQISSTLNFNSREKKNWDAEAQKSLTSLKVKSGEKQLAWIETWSVTSFSLSLFWGGEHNPKIGMQHGVSEDSGCRMHVWELYWGLKFKFSTMPMLQKNFCFSKGNKCTNIHSDWWKWTINY